MSIRDRSPFSRVHLPVLLTSPAKKKILGAVLIAGCSSLLSAVFVLTNGDSLATGALVAVIVVALVTLYRIDWGFFVFVFTVFFFDLFAPPGFSTFSSDVGYFRNLNAIGYLPKVEQAVVTPMELHLLLVFSVWLVTVVVRKDIRIVPVRLKLTLSAYFLAVVGSVIYGIAQGGDPIIALWEIRAMFYLGFVFLLVPQIIRTKEQLRTLMWVCIAGISLKAFQGAARFVALGFSFGSWPETYETLTNHEDPVFIVTLFIFLFGLLLFGGDGKQRRTLLWLLLPLLLGFIAGNRRAAYVSFMAAFSALMVLVPKRERWIALRVMAGFAVVFVLYLGVFWNSSSRLATGAMQFKATITDEGGLRGDKDRLSKLYRDNENYDLAITLRGAPVVGVGFGIPFQMPMRLWATDLNKLGKYIAHNQIFWIFVKMGIIGGFLFWFFFNSYVFQSASIFSRLTDPYLKAVCAVMVIAVVNQLVVSYVDMQLNWARNTVYLGLLMGLVSALPHIDTFSQRRVDPLATSGPLRPQWKMHSQQVA